MGLLDFFRKKDKTPQKETPVAEKPLSEKTAPEKEIPAAQKPISEKPSAPSLTLEERYGKASLSAYKSTDWTAATEEFLKLEEQGLGEASVALGQLAQMDNKEKALTHFRKAAAKGIAEGAWGYAGLIGHQYIADINGEDKEWYQYCLQAANKGCCDAMNELGNMYNRIEDYLGAFYWYQMAAYYEQPNGYQTVMALLNKWRNSGSPTVSESIDGVRPNDVANATRIFRCMTKQDTLDPALMDTFMHLAMEDNNEIMGLFIGHFFEDAVKMDGNAKMGYQLAAHNNSIMGMKCLADMLAAGRGCERNMQNALGWYIEAANLGEKTACFIMGEFYRTQNKKYLAAYYYSMSFRRGYQPAYTRLLQH